VTELHSGSLVKNWLRRVAAYQLYGLGHGLIHVADLNHLPSPQNNTVFSTKWHSCIVILYCFQYLK
jgi:hypothetical protein